jgi:hypothetical protein
VIADRSYFDLNFADKGVPLNDQKGAKSVEKKHRCLENNQQASTNAGSGKSCSQIPSLISKTKETNLSIECK